MCVFILSDLLNSNSIIFICIGEPKIILTGKTDELQHKHPRAKLSDLLAFQNRNSPTGTVNESKQEAIQRVRSDSASDQPCQRYYCSLHHGY